MCGAKSLVYAALLTAGLVCASAASADVAGNHIRDVRVHADDAVAGGAQIEIVGSGAPTYSVRVADSGRRLLVDLSGSDVAGAPAAITTPVGVVGGILTQSYETGAGPMTRLTVSLQRAASYKVVPEGTTLRVLVAPAGPALPTTTAPASAQKGTTPAPATAVVRDVRFERAPGSTSACAPNGCDRVVVDLGSIPAYALSTSPSGQLRLELRDTSLPDTLARALDVTCLSRCASSRSLRRTTPAAVRPCLKSNAWAMRSAPCPSKADR